ncbi:hybrid sensor histidine kinase/response regulator [Leptolyngbya sp. KIOST-1]|uniref:hybrid sensor histidine kinase/response regulator n=1 Tax=Leptolyngbya sp. KIOST-1 TaxID=1229172 RepID=UPI001CECE70E|nr:hybrid sensor histidine kinase/response regulator [Leptolyngbya sp. KIOST-1]
MVPFVSQVALAVGLTGWFSLLNGEKAIAELVTQLHLHLASQVTHHLEDRLALPILINELNTDAINTGRLDLSNFEQIEQTFHRQIKLFDVGYINFANPQGEFIGIERSSNGQILINETRQPFLSRMSIYQTDAEGNRIGLMEVSHDQPPVVEEAWYADAIAAQAPAWSSIYQWDDKPEIMSISSSYPIYDEDNTLQGVIGVDLLISDLNQFLRDLDSGGEIFIVERSGLLVASSKPEPFFANNADNSRSYAVESKHLLIQKAAKCLLNKYGSFSEIKSSQQFDFPVLGKRDFLQVTPWQDSYGLDWLIVIVVPRSNFMEQINANTRTTVLLCLLALISAIFLGLITSRWMSQYIHRLVKVTQEIADGNLEQTVDSQPIQELDDLAQTVNQMALELKESFFELEDRVAQRTAELLEAKNTAEMASRAKSEFLESISHELRTPLNAILGVTQVFQSSDSLSPEDQENWQIIYRNGNHLLALINDLLAIAKIGKYQMELASDRFDQRLTPQFSDSEQLDKPPVDLDLKGYLTQMSPDWIDQLHCAAIKGLDHDIIYLISQIPAELSLLAFSLTAWAKDFRFENIIDLIQKIKEDYE